MSYGKTIQAARNGQYISPFVRLALFICRCQSAEAIEKVRMWKDMQIKAADSHELSILFDLFLAHFQQKNPTGDENFEIHWMVDYGPDHELDDIFREWRSKVAVIRQSNDTYLPLNLCYKAVYVAQEGCARANETVIRMDGTLCEQNPWEKFYRNGNPADERVAKALQPFIPTKWKTPIINRSIARTMDYGIDDVVDLANSKNWGVVKYLLETEELPIEIGYKLLFIAHHNREWSIISLIYHRGFPLIDLRRSDVGPFFGLFGDCDPFVLADIISRSPNLPILYHRDLAEVNDAFVSSLKRMMAKGEEGSDIVTRRTEQLWIKLNQISSKNSGKELSKVEKANIGIKFLAGIKAELVDMWNPSENVAMGAVDFFMGMDRQVVNGH